MRKRPKVLIVEDESAAVRVMTLALEREGLEVHATADGSAALGLIPELHPDVLVADYLLPGISGIDVLRYSLRRFPDLPVVMITGHGDERIAVETMRLGAFSYLPKPLDYEELALVLRRACELRALRQELRTARVDGCSQQIVGQSPAIERLREMIADVAPTEVTVLIIGETGTGKEVVARAVHAASKRSRKRLVALNCAAIPETLLEAELFGYVRGAFTGAEGRREGKLLSTNGGTLFLDEIGDLPASLQPKLLRVIEEGEITPLGSDASQKIDVRLIAATHRDLGAEVAAGRFRADLFYRLNVVPIALPPLRERREDIPLLVQHVLPRLAHRHARQIHDVEDGLMEWLRKQSWPGNVRELENTLERLIVLNRDGVLRLPSDARTPFLLPYHDEKRQILDDFERRYLTDALRLYHGKLNEVAQRSGISQRQLYNLLRKHNLESLSDTS